MSQARRFILTYWLEEEELPTWREIASTLSLEHTFFTCQLEQSDGEGKFNGYHIQAYCECDVPRRYEWYGHRGWHAVRVGTDNGASSYARKEATRVEEGFDYGTPKQLNKKAEKAEDKLAEKNKKILELGGKASALIGLI